MPPLVSILIPTHNRPQWLPDAIASALAQTYEHLEVCVVDDGGRPETAAAVARFRDGRLRHHVTAPAQGLERNHRAALGLARGEWVVFLSDDDVIEPEFVARRVALASGDEGVSVVFSGYTIADEKLRDLRRVSPGWHEGRQLAPTDLAGAALARQWSINASLYRASTLREAWPPAGAVGNAFDTTIHLRMALLLQPKGVFGPWCDVKYRTHPAQESRGDAALRHFAEGERMYRHVLSLPMSRAMRRRVRADFANWQVVWGRSLAVEGQVGVARRRLARAVLTAPWVAGAWSQLVLAWLSPSRLRLSNT